MLVNGKLYLEPKDPATAGDSYGFKIDVTGILTSSGTTGPRRYGVYILGGKESGALSVAGCDDAMLRISGNNYAANTAVYNFRGLNCNVSNRSGGVVGSLENLISISLKQGSTTTYAKALTVDAQDLAATAKTEFGGIDVSLNREGLAATLEYGIQVRTRGTINTDITQALYFRKDATDHAFGALFGVDAAATLAITSAASVTCSVKIPILIAGVTYYIAAGTSTT